MSEAATGAPNNGPAHPAPPPAANAGPAISAVAAQRLHRRARRGDVAGVLALLGRQPRLLYAQDHHGKSPLMVAAYRGHLGLVRALLEGHEARRDEGSGREVCGRCTTIMVRGDGAPCCCLLRKSESLMLGAWFGHPRIVRLLLERGADPSVRNSWGCTPLMIAAEVPFPCVVGCLLEHEAQRASSAPPSSTRTIDAQSTADGRTALAIACEQGNAEVCQMLLLHGADPGLRDRRGRDALAIATAKKEEACVFLLHEWDRAHALRRARTLAERWATVTVAAAVAAAIPSSEEAREESERQQAAKRPKLDHQDPEVAQARLVAAAVVEELCPDTFSELMGFLGRTSGEDMYLRFPPLAAAAGVAGAGEEEAGDDDLLDLVIDLSSDGEDEDEDEGEEGFVGEEGL